MGLETSFQVSTVSTTAKACVPYAHHPFYSKQKLNLPTCKGPKVSSLFSSPSASSSSFAPSIDRRCRGLRLVCKAREAVNEVVAVTDASWTDLVIGSQNPALVEFWAPWCGPCRMIAPVIDELAKEYAGKIVCYKVNTDECPQIAKEYGIRSIPTVLLFKNGEKKSSLVGAVPKATLTATIEKYLEM